MNTVICMDCGSLNKQGMKDLADEYNEARSFDENKDSEDIQHKNFSLNNIRKQHGNYN